MRPAQLLGPALAAVVLFGSLPNSLTAQGEPVPPSAVVDGKPQGIFVGRSLLTGRAVCLLFLSGGRVTRFIPVGGLENFDWARHQAGHAGDSGTWELVGGQLRITWGDGGVHQGPLTIRPGGIEFYGKRYTAPGTAIAGGSGINSLISFSVESGGRYHWTNTTGGVVAGRATAAGSSRSGKLKISGQTIRFEADDGTAASYTFLPVPGVPLGAFSIDADLFTRMD